MEKIVADLNFHRRLLRGARPNRILNRYDRKRERDGSVGATFQLGAKFGAGRSGGIEKTSLISLTSEERRARPHMRRS
jgi:hypothetical protein